MSRPRRIVLYVVFLLVVPILILGWIVAQPSFFHNKSSQAAVSPQRLASHVAVLAEQYAPRSFYDSENLAQCADYIRLQFAQTSGIVSNQLYTLGSVTGENVIVTFPGEDATRIVVGAHYDSCGTTPGADDNASGVAGLIELARLLSDVELRHTVELVAFSTEEPPFFGCRSMGSARYAELLVSQGVDVRAMLALEMIGYFSDDFGSQTYPIRLLHLFYPSRGNFLAIIGNMGQRKLLGQTKRLMRGTTALPVYSACVPNFVPGVDYSDHRNFWAEGIPAVMIGNTAFYRNTAYHGDDDTADRLDYERMSQVVVALFEAVVGLASEE
jgi:Zn-dependent M28 family amino/carboxypeptidase